MAQNPRAKGIGELSSSEGVNAVAVICMGSPFFRLCHRYDAIRILLAWFHPVNEKRTACMGTAFHNVAS
jgi:hypothetical protein